MNKKALAVVKLVAGVIILASIVFFMIYLVKVGFRARSVAVDSECATSIIAHTTLVNTFGGDVTPDIYCPTKYYTISSRDGDEIKKFMADEMRVCWGTWGKGRLELFKDDGFYCHICSLVDFKGDQNQVNGLLDYLSNTHIPAGDGQGMTYIQYLASTSTEDVDPKLESAIKSIQSPYLIDTTKQYAILFAYARGEEAMKKFLEKAGSIVGGGLVGGATGAVVGGVLVVGAKIATLGAVAASGGTILVIAAAGAIIGAVIAFATDDIQWTSVVTVEEFNAKNLAEIGCEISDVKQDRQGDTLG